MLNVEEKGSESPSPLAIACMQGQQNVVKRLLEHGACVETGLDSSGHSTIYHAIQPDLDESLVETMLDRISSVAEVTDIGDILFRAVKLGYPRVVKRCLSRDPPIKLDDNVELVNRRDKDHRRIALHYAAELGHADTVLLLLNAIRDSKKDELVDARDDSENTPLALQPLPGRCWLQNSC